LMDLDPMDAHASPLPKELVARTLRRCGYGPLDHIAACASNWRAESALWVVGGPIAVVGLLPTAGGLDRADITE
ncbi:MAG TPA: hypothetical protein VMK12_30795, partial [Anaeromyxobacteraceae bacterium]|nr:hypothetical protein [Anaeromyxobacteraceae bacterium]